MTDISKMSNEELMALLNQHAQAQPEAPPETGFNPGLIGGMLGVKAPAGFTAKTAKMIQGTKDFGTGIPKLAYDIGGGVTDIASKVFPPEVAAGLGYGANVFTQAVPALFAGNVSASAGAPVIQSGARSIMQSAVKPTLNDLRSGDAAKAIDTMLQEGYNPTKGGVAAMKSKIADLGDEISKAIGSSKAMINKNVVAARLGDAVKKFEMQVNPQADTQAVERAWNEFLSHPLLAGKTEMPVQLAQTLKQGTYQQLGDKAYGELGTASTEAQKALARGLKEEISKAVPSVAGLNARQAELINAADIAQRRALLQPNLNPAGLALLAKNPGAGAAFLADRSALVKALIARGLYSNANAIPFALGAGTEPILTRR